jgi:hypothetical protein
MLLLTVVTKVMPIRAASRTGMVHVIKIAP